MGEPITVCWNYDYHEMPLGRLFFTGWDGHKERVRDICSTQADKFYFSPLLKKYPDGTCELINLSVVPKIDDSTPEDYRTAAEFLKGALDGKAIQKTKFDASIDRVIRKLEREAEGGS